MNGRDGKASHTVLLKQYVPDIDLCGDNTDVDFPERPANEQHHVSDNVDIDSEGAVPCVALKQREVSAIEVGSDEEE